MNRADTRVYTTLTDEVPIDATAPFAAALFAGTKYGQVSIGVDLSIFGSADNLTRLAVALLAAAAAGDPPEYDREADEA